MPVEQALASLKIPRSAYQAFASCYLIYQAKLNLKPVWFPGVNSMLQKLSQPLLPATGIVTSGDQDEIRSLKRAYPAVSKDFWITVTAEATINHKPAPDPLLTALSRIGMRPDQSLYVGDAVSDELAARNAKMDFGIAGWGADPKIHFQTAKYRFQRPRDILHIR